MVDSGCEPTQAFMEKYNLNFVGSNIIMDGKRYVDGEQVPHEPFYAHVAEVNDFSTVPPSQSDMIHKFKTLKAKGYQRVIVFHLSSKLSQICGNSQAAKGFVPGLEIHVIDTNQVSAGGYFVAEKGITMINDGRSTEEVDAALPEITRSAQVLLPASTLKYFVKNGRIGKAQGLVGAVLRVKPVPLIDDGIVTPFATEKDLDKAIAPMADASLAFLAKSPHNVKIYKGYGAQSNKPYVDQALDRLMNKLHQIPIKDYEVISGRGGPPLPATPARRYSRSRFMVNAIPSDRRVEKKITCTRNNPPVLRFFTAPKHTPQVTKPFSRNECHPCCA